MPDSGKTSAIGVVVPTFNGRDVLSACLDALRKQTFRDFTVHVVDNASTDGTAEMLEAEHPEVHLVRNSRNLRFAAAVNAGIRAGREPYIALLNNDACPAPNWLAELHARAVAHAGESAWASVMLWTDRPDILQSAGLTLRADGTPLALRRGEPLSALAPQPVEVLTPSGGAGLYRRSLFEDIGLFDERFEMYVEDLELGLRARLAGHRCTLVPSARVDHRHRTTTSRTPGLTAYFEHRNMVLCLLKTMPFGFLCRVLPRFIFTGLRPLVAAPWRCEGWAMLGAKFGVLRHAPYALGKRREIRGAMRASDDDIERLFA